MNILVSLDPVPCPVPGLDMACSEACGEDTGKLGYTLGGWKLDVIFHSSLIGDPTPSFAQVGNTVVYGFGQEWKAFEVGGFEYC